MRRLLVRTTTLIALVVASGAIIPMRAALAASPLPFEAAGCQGGDSSQPSIGQSLAADQPQFWAALPDADKQQLDSVYPGETCWGVVEATPASVPSVPVNVLSVVPSAPDVSTDLAAPPLAEVGSTPPPPSVGNNISSLGTVLDMTGVSDLTGVHLEDGEHTANGGYGTQDFDYCPGTNSAGATLGTLAYPGCVTAMSSWFVDYSPGTFRYTVFTGIVCDVYLRYYGCYPTLTGSTFHDNEGNKWGQSTEYDTSYTIDGKGWAWAASTSGTGSYDYISFPWFTGFQNYLDSFVTFGEGLTLHEEYKGKDIDQAEPHCWFAEFQSRNADFMNGGPCANVGDQFLTP